MFSIRNLRADYGDDDVLRGCDLDVAPGEIIAVIGRNGVGKTTFLRALMGAIPSSGTVALDALPLARAASEERFERGLTYVPQGHRIFPSLSLGENIEIGARLRGAMPWTIGELQRRIPLLAARWGQSAATLSGGETQLVILARALAGNGRVLLADEPAEGLDTRAEELLAELLRDAARRDTAIVITEARTAYVRELAARTFEIVDGMVRIVE